MSTPSEPHDAPNIVPKNLKIPLRDGNTIDGSALLGDDEPRPVLLTRGSIKGTDPHWPEWVNNASSRFLEAGYHCVATDYRVSPSYEQDRVDGYDVVEWIAAQEWCNGQVVMTGKSKFGITAVRAAQTNPPHLVAIIPHVHGLDIKPPEQHELGRGQPVSSWEEYLAVQVIADDDESEPAEEPRRPEQYPDLNEDEPWEYTAWNPINAQEQFEAIDIPMFHYGGWYDRYPDLQTIHYLAAKKFSKSPNVRLVIDVTDHLGRVMGKRPFRDVPYNLQDDVIQWLQPILKGDTRQTGPAVTMYAMGADEWRTYDQWPPPERKQTRFHLSAPDGSAEGGLTMDIPGNEKPSVFTYDPDSPCPTLGCSNSEPREVPLMPIGPYDQQSLGDRDDVLVFRTPPLSEPVDVTGPLMAKLFAATDVPGTQWVVQVLDEFPDGTCYNLMEGNSIAQVREPGEVQEYILDIRATSNVFMPGHRIRIHVMSSLFPLWERNLNTGTRTARAEDIGPAHNEIFHDHDHPSFIMLPVMGK